MRTVINHIRMFTTASFVTFVVKTCLLTHEDHEVHEERQEEYVSLV